MSTSEVRLDPRLEQQGLWHDFHARFIVALANHLSEALAPRYVAVVDERVYLAIEEDVPHRSVAIRTPAGQLVTSLELLSPHNKRPGHEGRRSYRQKRDQLLAAGVHLVEMDFLLGGERMPLATDWPACDRAVLVVRAHRLHAGELYPFGADDPLPTVALPLLSPEPDSALALQPVLEQVWRTARYDVLLGR